ncbi:MAG: type III PLP-dependent enzyme [Neomegalonema sp.]|nr:type III PLP-dependent enzyme [Neomegalonema sp.]
MFVGEFGARLRTREIEEDIPTRVNAAVDFEGVRGGVTEAISEFLAATPYEGPRLVMDLDLVEQAYRRLHASLDGAPLYYAVKANPNPQILRRLNQLGARFDVASRGEIARCLELGFDPGRLSFGNTVKRPSDIAFAYANGVDGFAFDAEEELVKIAEAAPGARVFCRLLVEECDADWPLSRKFGCAPEMAERLFLRAVELGLKPIGLSFHVGSQMRDPSGWRKVLTQAAALWRRVSLRGVRLEMLNIGGGFPARYSEGAPPMAFYGARILDLISEAFNGHPPKIIAEPGRGLVGDAGVIEAEVLLVSRKSDDDPKRWVYLDIGKFGGLAETTDEAIRYRILTDRDGGAVGPCVLAGPTCDSVDVMYERDPVMLPLGLKAGDRVLIPATGAYTTTYASVWFNGIEPMQEFTVG